MGGDSPAWLLRVWRRRGFHPFPLRAGPALRLGLCVGLTSSHQQVGHAWHPLLPTPGGPAARRLVRGRCREKAVRSGCRHTAGFFTEMAPLSIPGVAPSLAAWPGTRRWFLGLAPLPHGQELHRSRASGQDTYSVLA